MDLKKVFFTLVAFIGWILSPLTWWNDTFVNVPLAYVMASLMNRVLPGNFPLLFLTCYWFTNVLGIALMFIGAKNLYKKKAVVQGLIMIVIYSAILIVVAKTGILKPF